MKSVPSSVEAGDSLGYTPLHFAAWNGHLKVVHFLMDKANLEAKNYNGETPLHLAAQWGHLNVVKALARHKANIFAKDQQKSSAIHWAARKGHEEVVEYLITENSKLLTEPGTESRTVLHEAATLGHMNLVKLLIQKNAELLKMASEDNETALHAAVNQGHLAVVKYLVENKIDVAAQDNDGQTAEALAAKLGKHDIVRFLQGLNESEEIVAHDIKAEEIKAIAIELPEIAQPGPIPAMTTRTGQTVHVAVPRPKRMGYRQAIGRSNAGIRAY
jgi:ankyrin repeat protein